MDSTWRSTGLDRPKTIGCKPKGSWNSTPSRRSNRADDFVQLGDLEPYRFWPFSALISWIDALPAPLHQRPCGMERPRLNPNSGPHPPFFHAGPSCPIACRWVPLHAQARGASPPWRLGPWSGLAIGKPLRKRPQAQIAARSNGHPEPRHWGTKPCPTPMRLRQAAQREMTSPTLSQKRPAQICSPHRRPGREQRPPAVGSINRPIRSIHALRGKSRPPEHPAKPASNMGVSSVGQLFRSTGVER